MKRQIAHMIKYKYLPFSLGKKVCVGACSAHPGMNLPAVLATKITLLLACRSQKYPGKVVAKDSK
eukprot:364034-Chlamydomonas_euryale.AAC.14